MTQERPVAKQPLVSICIPVRSMIETIKGTIGSALAQTYSNIEILVVDNCSDDGTPEAVSSIKDARVRLVRNDVDLGVYGNHNRCLELARGEFVKFLHGDDLLEHDCVERMLKPFLAPMGEAVGLVACGGIELGPGDVESRRTPIPRAELRMVGREFVNMVPQLGNFIGTPTMTLLRKSKVLDIRGFEPTLRHAADFDCWLALAQIANYTLVPYHLVRLRNDPPPMDISKRYNAEQIIQYIGVLHKWYGRSLGGEPLWRSKLGEWMARESVLYLLAFSREVFRGRPGQLLRLLRELRRYKLLPELLLQMLVTGPSIVKRRIRGDHHRPYQAVEKFYDSRQSESPPVL